MYSLEVATRITKELLLSKHTQETYFEHYLGIPVKKGLFCSPPIIRVDKKPTCAFYKDGKGILKYKDFAGPSFDFVGAVMYIYICSYYKALRIIGNDFGFIELDKVPKNPAKIPYTGCEFKETERAMIQVEIQEFSKKELSWWESFGISKKTLEKFKVYSIKSVFLNGSYFTSSTEHSPIYGYYGGKNSNDDELWRLYMPTKVKYRFLSNWSSAMIQGAKQLPKEGDFIVVTKSLKDVMSLYEFGITAIAPNSENLFLTDSQYLKVQGKFKDIYLLYDRDLPGVRAANKIRKQFPAIKILLVPKVKDFTDYVKRYGILRTLNLVEEWLQKRRLQNL
ncbi:MAG: toprim domain-containing protein [Candidatus Saccharimonadaceae bacterium]